MKYWLIILVCLLMSVGRVTAQDVLIVADEIPAMEVLAKGMQQQEGLTSKIVTQTDMPATLANFRAVIVYIHKDLDSIPERAFIRYAQNGGKLLCLHHSISSAKRKNKEWFSFLGIDLPKKDVSEGGYKYVGDVDMAVVNLAPKHFITSHKITYASTIAYTREGSQKEGQFPGFVLQKTEGFLNHQLLGSRTILLGFKFTDTAGKVWMQDRSAWCIPVGKGWLFYSQPGHAISDFENLIYTQLIANAILYKP
ncbi:ThuA domain-containing protein [Spirosoma sp. KNUC1025]|uniref:ThuA domain-containing protein n=1 Tax=Spirosoma sp. KNUC1025 TaxID=2894082 RepID=UPI001E2B210E|nr:ThuA domain-containing protein [Spirosoma sp. KNUC1025]UFH57948.1 ThuA domain-containing protein [Spirosoma sp. KNUC1025]